MQRKIKKEKYLTKDIKEAIKGIVFLLTLRKQKKSKFNLFTFGIHL